VRWLFSAAPLELVAHRPCAAKAEFEKWVGDQYDFVWFSKVRTYVLLGQPKLGPTVIDFDDLEDQKLLARVDATNSADRFTISGFVHGAGARAQTRLNARRWAKLQTGVARAAGRVVVCSDLDRQRLGSANAAVVPNGYDATDVPAGRSTVGDPPVLLLQGSLSYGPNADAARWLVTEILPHIQVRCPGVRVRLVGEPHGGVTPLHAPPVVTVVGRVATMEDELARADLVVVPIRYGSGTRIKILEAFAHRIPVVSTTIGAEGLEVRADVHFLMADDADGLARACVRLLEDRELRARVVDEAHSLFLARYQWSTARDLIQGLALELAGSGSP